MATAQTDLAVNSGITLQKRVLSFPEVLAQSVANMAPSAAMALLPLFVFFSAGNGAWLSFGISMVILLIVAYCVSQFATRINSAGSFYVWVARAIGPGAGSTAGWGLVLGYLFTGIACVIGFEIYGNNFLAGFGISSPSNHVVKAILYIVGGLAPAVMAVPGDRAGHQRRRESPHCGRTCTAAGCPQGDGVRRSLPEQDGAAGDGMGAALLL